MAVDINYSMYPLTHLSSSVWSNIKLDDSSFKFDPEEVATLFQVTSSFAFIISWHCVSSINAFHFTQEIKKEKKEDEAHKAAKKEIVSLLKGNRSNNIGK